MALRRVLSTGFAAGVLLIVTAFVASKLSPWPSAMVIRWAFERDGAATNAALGAQAPSDIRTQAGLRYDPNDPRALLDIHRPTALEGRRLPVVVWIHGGGFIAGSRKDLANYARILAADGYAVAAVDYALSPEARYPAAVQQLNRALAYLSANAVQLQLDADRFILGGDSAGAQLASQLAALASSPDYAAATGLYPGISREQLRGVVLFCGPHDARLMPTDASSWFVRTVMRSYLGSATPPRATLLAFSVVPHVTSAFPPAFITVGNDDPLAAQSFALADALQRQGVRVETLFYPASHAPPLKHEYQFDLSRPESREALRRTRAFLRETTGSGKDVE
jgi:acetyl esterase